MVPPNWVKTYQIPTPLHGTTSRQVAFQLQQRRPIVSMQRQLQHAVSIIVSSATGPPVVTITSPTTGSTFIVGTSVSFAVTATDANGSINRVEFFNGATKLGEDLSSPYSFTWNNVVEGTYIITARATDNQGVTATDEVEVFVNPPNISPEANAGEDLEVQLPINSLTIQGSGTDADGVTHSLRLDVGCLVRMSQPLRKTLSVS